MLRGRPLRDVGIGNWSRFFIEGRFREKRNSGPSPEHILYAEKSRCRWLDIAFRHSHEGGSPYELDIAFRMTFVRRWIASLNRRMFVVWLGTAFLVALWLIPPWKEEHHLGNFTTVYTLHHSPINRPPTNYSRLDSIVIDYGRLALESFAICLLTAVIFLSVGRPPRK